MNTNDLLRNLTPEIIARFKTAIETGRWPNGEKLQQQQLETCMQAVIIYEQKYVPEHQRTGYLPPKKTPCATDHDQPLNWQQTEKGD